jgi:hypothetical protein
VVAEPLSEALARRETVFGKVRLMGYPGGTALAVFSGMSTQANHDHNEQRRPQESAPEFQQEKRAMSGWTVFAIVGMLGVFAWFLLRGGT